MIGALNFRTLSLQDDSHNLQAKQSKIIRKQLLAAQNMAVLTNVVEDLTVQHEALKKERAAQEADIKRLKIDLAVNVYDTQTLCYSVYIFAILKLFYYIYSMI
jgi:hypothetical protein